MDIIHLIRILLRRWWLVAIPTAITAALALPAFIGTGSAVSGGFSTRFTYSAAQDLAAVPRTEGDYQDIWLASELTVNALTDWITSSSFVEEISQHLAEQDGIDIDAAALVGRFASDNERSVGQVFIGWPDADQLEAIAQAAVWVLQNRNAVYFAQLGGTPATVTLLDAPRIVGAPPPLTDRFGPLIRVGLGLVAGIGLAVLAHLFDRVLRRREDIEALGIPVVVAIPRR